MEIHFSTILTSMLHGLILGMVLVIVAGGLTIIFGMLDVLNFAHGSLYMLGGYFGYTLAKITGSYWLALIIAPIIVGGIGFIIEYFSLRPLYGRPPLHHLLLTFGISLIVLNAIKFIWGNDIYTVSIPSFLSGATNFLGISYPTYHLFVLFFSIGMAILLWLLISKTRYGVAVRAGTEDIETLEANGIDSRKLFTAVFVVGSALAAIAGAVGSAVALGTAAGSFLKGTPAYAQASSSPIKIGVVLPFSGSYKVIGDRVQAGLELSIHMAGGKIKGRPVTIIKEDSEMKPDVGLTKTKKLVEKDKVDFLVGPVNSAVFVVMRNYATEKKIVQIVPTAGNIELAGNLYSPYVFRSSISHWIFAHPMGYWVYDNLGPECFVLGANYAAGQHQVWAFTMAYRGKGGKIIGAVYPPLNEKDYSSYITKIADSGAKAYFGWVAGNDAVNFCRQAAQFGLSKKVKMSTSGWFFEDNLLVAQGETAIGWYCCFNWTQTLDTPFNKEFISQYNKYTKNDKDVAVSMSSVHGYDAGQLIVKSVEATGGDTNAEKIIPVMEKVKLVSPRGDVWLDAQHDMVQPMYIAEIVKSGSGVEPKMIAKLGHWTTPLLGANGVSNVGQPFIVK